MATEKAEQAVLPQGKYMPKINCPHCEKTLKVVEELSGKRGKCPACGQAFLVPAFSGGSATSAIQSHERPENSKNRIVGTSLGTPAQSQEKPIQPHQIQNEPTPQEEQIREQLRRIIDAYSKAIGRLSAPFGYLIVLAILAGIIVCLSYSWLLGILGGSGVVALLAFVNNRLEVAERKRAKENIAALEKNSELTHEELLDLLLLQGGSRARLRRSAALKAIVVEVWGKSAIGRIQNEDQRQRGKRQQQRRDRWEKRQREAGTKSEPRAAECPKCGSRDLMCEKSALGKAAGYVAGAAVGALFASVLGFGRLAGEAMTYAGAKEGASLGPGLYKCRHCGYEWKIKPLES